MSLHTLLRLLRAPRLAEVMKRPSLCLLLPSSQSLPAGTQFTLEFVEPELKLVRKLLLPVSTVSFTKATSVNSTKSVALRTLRDNHWFRFACHGTQNLGEPFNSAFLMHDQPLTLLDIAQSDLSRQGVCISFRLRDRGR